MSETGELPDLAELHDGVDGIRVLEMSEPLKQLTAERQNGRTRESFGRVAMISSVITCVGGEPASAKKSTDRIL